MLPAMGSGPCLGAGYNMFTMAEKRTRIIVDTVIAFVLYIAMDFFDDRINRLMVAGILCAIIILVTIIWPDEVEEEEEQWISPTQQRMEKLGQALQEVTTIPTHKSMEAMGYVRRKVKVKRRKFFWQKRDDELREVRRWNSETCEWELDWE